MTQSSGPYNTGPSGVWGPDGQFYPDPATNPNPNGGSPSGPQGGDSGGVLFHVQPGTSLDQMPANATGQQGYLDPVTGNVYNYPKPGTYAMQRPGTDVIRPGHMSNPYAGDYGGAPGVAQSEEARYATLADQQAHQQSAQINNDQFNQDRFTETQSRGDQQTGLQGLQGVSQGYGALGQQYSDLAAGRGPSLADKQMAQGIAASNAQQASIAASARGGGANLAAAQQSAANAAANASGNAIMGAETARAGEQLSAMSGQATALQGQAGAQQAYGQLATSQRAADLQREGLSAQQATAQAQLEQQQHTLNLQGQMGFEQQRQNVFNQQQQGAEWTEGQNFNEYASDTGQALANNQNNFNQATTAASTGASLASVGIPLAMSLATNKSNGTNAPPGALPSTQINQSASTLNNNDNNKNNNQSASTFNNSLTSDIRQKSAVIPGGPKVEKQLSQLSEAERLKAALNASGPAGKRALAELTKGASHWGGVDRRDMREAQERAAAQADEQAMADARNQATFSAPSSMVGMSTAYAPQEGRAYGAAVPRPAAAPTYPGLDLTPREEPLGLLKKKPTGTPLFSADDYEAARQAQLARMQSQPPISQVLRLPEPERAPAGASLYLRQPGQPAPQPMAMVSDEDEKTGVKDHSAKMDAVMRGLLGKDHDADMQDTLDHLHPYDYRYKDQRMGEGRRVGVMAQDLEKSRLGRDVVMDTLAGKAIDVNKGLSLSLAGLAHIHSTQEEQEDRLKALEEHVRAKRRSAR